MRHDANGVVERAMATVGTCFRAMMIQGCAPDSEIPNALVHAVVVRNNSPTKANKSWTPLEVEAGMRLGANKRLLKGPLFCLVYAHVYKEERAKHDPRGVPCVYQGFDDQNNQFKVKEWRTGDVYYTGDAVFHPSIFPYRASPQLAEHWMNEMDAVTPRVPVTADKPRPNAMPTGPRRSERQHGYHFSGAVDLRQLPDEDTPPDQQSDQSEAVDPTEAHYVHSFGPDPKNWGEALASPYASEWIIASLAEKQSFLEHQVYTLVPRSEAARRKIYKPKAVFKIKINPPTKDDPHATIDKFKFRLTIAAYTKSMKQGVDYEEKRASTVRWEAILAIIAVAVKYDLDIALIDINTFFLYGHLPDLVSLHGATPGVGRSRLPSNRFRVPPGPVDVWSPSSPSPDPGGAENEDSGEG